MALTTGFFKERVKAFPTLLPDATTIAPLAAGAAAQQLFSYAGLASSGRLVTLRSLRYLSSAGVSIAVQADRFGTVPSDTVATSLLAGPDPLAGPLVNAVAASNLSAILQNTSGAAVASYWANWSVLVDNPSVAQLIKLGKAASLSASQQALAQKYGLAGATPRGVVPRTFEWIRDNEYKTQLVDVAPLGQTKDVPAGGVPILFAQDNAKAGEMLVLAGLIGSPGTGADGLAFVVQIDDDQSFLVIPAYPAGQVNGGVAQVALPIFAQAESQIQVYASSQGGTNNVSLAASIWHVRLTDEIRYRMGDNTVPQAVQDKIDVGVL